MTTLLIVLLACLLCAVFGALAGADRGNAPAGFILGLLFGPLGVIMALLIKEPTRHQRGSKVDPDVWARQVAKNNETL